MAYSLFPLCGCGAGGAPSSGGGGGGCSQATTFLARTSGLDTTHQNAYTTFICGLVTDGLWTKFDVLYVFATADSTTAKLNLVSTSFGASLVGTPTFTVDRGYLSTGTGAYISTGFNPSTAPSPNFTQNSAHISAWSNTNGTASTGLIGQDNTHTNLIPKFTDNNFYGRVNDATSLGGFAMGSTIGQALANRDSSTNREDYFNGSSVGTGTTASQAVLSANVLVLSVDGSLSDATHQVAMASVGSSLNSTDASNFYSRALAYLQAVGDA